jgi:hypothetical protein
MDDVRCRNFHWSRTILGCGSQIPIVQKPDYSITNSDR